MLFALVACAILNGEISCQEQARYPTIQECAAKAGEKATAEMAGNFDKHPNLTALSVACYRRTDGDPA